MRDSARMFEDSCRQTLVREGGGELEIRRYSTQVGARSCELWLRTRRGAAHPVGPLPDDLDAREAERIVARANGQTDQLPASHGRTMNHAPDGGYQTSARYILGPDL